MEKAVFAFENFLADVSPAYCEFAETIHGELLGDGYRCRIESKANGFLVSYSHPQTKRSILNFLFRKGRLHVRLYADCLDGYAGLLDRLPGSMERAIAKAPVCKRLLDPAQCNSRCPMGYAFTIRGSRYQKCRYNCFLLEVTPESAPVLAALIGEERGGRRALKDSL